VRDPGLILVEMLDWLAPKKAHPLTIVECGTIRNPSFEGHEDGLSTYHVAKWAHDTGGWHDFLSFELSHGALGASRDFLIENGGLASYVTYGLGDATLLLEHFNAPIDLCYLDAGADPFQNLAQYRYASKWLRPPGMIVIDDVFDARNANRGLLTVPYAQTKDGGEHRVACIEGRLALISFGVDDYPLPEGSYWL
jgi:predicted O-methyltransferase YrrM